MKFYTLALVLFLTVAAGTASAQRFSELRNRRGDNPMLDNSFEVFIRRTQVSGKYTTSFGGTTFNFRWRFDQYEKGRWRGIYENPTLGDMLFVVGRLLKGDDVMVRTDEQSIGSGFLGWMQWHYNFVATDRLLISAGPSLGDYIFATKRAAPPAGFTQQVVDPAGYFFHLGPAFMATYLVGNSTWVDGFTHLDMGFKASSTGQTVEGYPRPLFLNVGANVHHGKTRLFGSFRVTQLIDRGSNKDSATRIDISAGYMFGRAR